MDWANLFSAEAQGYKASRPTARRFRFTGITIRGTQELLKKYTPEFDTYWLTQGYVPMTETIVREHETNETFVKVLGSQVEQWSSGFVFSMIGTVFEAFQNLLRFMKRTSDYEILDGRYFFVRRNHRKIIQKVFLIYASIKDMDTKKQVHFKRVEVLFQ